MSLTLIIILILAGLLFVMLEILVMPGVGVVGILGGAMIIFAVISAYRIDPSYGHISLISSVVLSALLIFIAVKTGTWKKMSLNKEIAGRVNIYDESLVKDGDIGITLSRLNPIGKASINDNIYEVESTEGYISENKEIVVVKATSHKIRVKSK